MGKQRLRAADAQRSFKWGMSEGQPVAWNSLGFETLLTSLPGTFPVSWVWSELWLPTLVRARGAMVARGKGSRTKERKVEMPQTVFYCSSLLMIFCFPVVYKWDCQLWVNEIKWNIKWFFSIYHTLLFYFSDGWVYCLFRKAHNILKQNSPMIYAQTR